MNLLIIIPAFNEEKTIAGVIEKIPQNIDGISKIKILVVNDGSRDDTEKTAIRLGVEVLSHKQNLGVGIALASGIKYALKNAYDIAVNIDADGQFDPGEIPDFIKPILKKQAEFVVGDRFGNGRPRNMPIVKYWGNKKMNKLISMIAQKKFTDVSCGFRAYSREAMLNLNLFGKFTYTQETILDFSFKNIVIKQMPVKVEYFSNRKSKVAHNLFYYTYKTLNIIIRSAVYYRPLKFFAYPGLLFILVGAVFVGFLAWHKIFIGSYSPYKATGFIGGGLMLFGALMVFIGLIADVIDKVRQNQEKILYFEKKRNYFCHCEERGNEAISR